jgi:hypothetical protein
MTMNELQDIIREHGTNSNFDVLLPRGVCNINRFDINGCDLLEYIDDVPGFVSLLGCLQRWDITRYAVVTFVGDYPDTIESILGGDIIFIAVNTSVCAYVDGFHYGMGDDVIV